MKIRYHLFLLFFIFPHLTTLGQDIRVHDLKEVDKLINNYQFEEALKILDTHPDSVTLGYWQRKGYCYFRLGDYDFAIKNYEKVVAADSSNRNALNQLGQLYLKINAHADAKECYKQLLAIDSSNSYYQKQYGIAASLDGDVATAINHLAKAVKLNYKDIEAYNALVNLLFDYEQYALADSILTAGLQKTAHPHLRLLLAKTKVEEQQYEEALKHAGVLLQQSDTTITIARLMGVSHFQLDHYEEVIPFMTFLLRNDVEADWVYYYLGMGYQQTGQVDLALINLNKAIEAGISENISTYYTQLATTFEQKKDFKKAIKYYKAAYESSRSDILLFYLARNYDSFYQDKQQAIAYYKKYLSSDDTIKIAREYTKQRLEQLMDMR